MSAHLSPDLHRYLSSNHATIEPVPNEIEIKLDNPEAFITYVRKANRRGDRRHPHEALTK